MLDSERTFKIGYVGQFSEFGYVWLAFKEFCMETIVQYLQKYKRHEFDQGHSRKLS